MFSRFAFSRIAFSRIMFSRIMFSRFAFSRIVFSRIAFSRRDESVNFGLMYVLARILSTPNQNIQTDFFIN